MCTQLTNVIGIVPGVSQQCKAAYTRFGSARAQGPWHAIRAC
jgi:hypothetical protein